VPAVPIVVGVLIVLIGISVFWVVRYEPGPEPLTSSSANSPGAKEPDFTASDETTGASGTTAATTDDSQAQALQQLEMLRAQDLARVTMNGQWVAQLASKYIGISDPYQTTTVGSHVFYASDILAEHQSLRSGDSQGTEIVLLLSTDYGARQMAGGQTLWVTFALGDFGSAQAVEAWCAVRFPALSGDSLTNACAARRLSAP
jgi:hypothetical protein